jgi:hypothetical protein
LLWKDAVIWPDITLGQADLERSTFYATERQRMNGDGSRVDAHGYTGDPFQIQLAGVHTEMATWYFFERQFDWIPVWYTLKPSQIPWDLRDPKTGTLYEVKSTPRAEGGLVCEESKLQHRHVLVLAHARPTYYFPGWLYGHEINREDWWRADWRDPRFCAPQGKLHRWT